MATTTTLSSWPERLLSSKKQRVIQGLVHGQDCATQLQILFSKSSEIEEEQEEEEEEGGSNVSAEQLVKEILRSFNDTISVLSSTDDSSTAEVVSQNQAAASNDDSPCCDQDRRSEDSSESRKRPASASASASKDKRGCYKRKRTVQTWVVVSSTMDDGRAWRKYGQKEILNSKYPRSYFRCTRKYDQGCKATKQVQRMEDDSQMFQITYIGIHTCKDSLKAPQMITSDSDQYINATTHSSGDDSRINTIPPTKQQQQQQQLSTPTSIKQESKEGTTPSDLTDLDSMIMWKDFNLMADPEMGSDNYGDVVSNVYSCTEITSGSFNIDFGIKVVDVDQFEDHDFHFEETFA